MTLQVEFGGDGPGMSKEEIDDYLKRAMAGYTAEQLRAAFATVQDAQHWKNPVDSIAPREMMAILAVAIPFITATCASFADTDDEDKVRVTADGYYASDCN